MLSSKPLILASLLMLASAYSTAKTVQPLEQLPQTPQPASLQYKSLMPSSAQLLLPKLELTELKSTAEHQKPGTGPYEFAKGFDDKSLWQDKGQWTQIGDMAIWRLKLTSDNAVSLSAGLHNVFLPQGAKLFFYSGGLKSAVEFNNSDNKEHGELWSPVFEDKELIIEVNVPASLKEYTQFEIKKISQGFRGIKSADLKSGDCNINVVCSQGDAWRDEIRSVARIVIGGTGLCTGTLINNLATDAKPYFISAEHCGINASTAPSMIFYWNFDASLCSMDTAQADGNLSQFQTGSTFKAAYATSDFALVQLDQAPDAAFNVHWAGWDAANTAPSSAVAIHHPQGDEKRISFENDPLTITQYASQTQNSNGTHLRVGAWDEGTTEGGSSGSSIWNSEKRIVGTLTGGAASCTNINGADWYGRMAKHWLGGNTSNTQLKAWLDPNNTGALAINGSDTGLDGIIPGTGTGGGGNTGGGNTGGGSSGGSSMGYFALLLLFFTRRKLGA